MASGLDPNRPTHSLHHTHPSLLFTGWCRFLTGYWSCYIFSVLIACRVCIGFVLLWQNPWNGQLNKAHDLFWLYGFKLWLLGSIIWGLLEHAWQPHVAKMTWFPHGVWEAQQDRKGRFLVPSRAHSSDLTSFSVALPPPQSFHHLPRRLWKLYSNVCGCRYALWLRKLFSLLSSLSVAGFVICTSGATSNVSHCLRGLLLCFPLGVS